MDTDAIKALVLVDATLQQDIADAAAALVVALMGSVSDWYDGDAVAAASARAGTVVQSASRASAARADAYLTTAIAQTLGRPATPAGVIPITRPLRNKVSGWSEIYERTAATVRLEVSRGRPLEDAVQIGLQRADAMCRTDIALARRQQWRATLTANPQVIGFRRVVHPELSKGGTCGLCIAASTRMYTRRELLPIHDRCKCTVAPVTNVHDPGLALNDADLKALYNDAGGTTRADKLKRTRYKVVEHGEVGPTLVNPSHSTRTPREVARDTGRRDVGREIAALEKSHADLQRRLDAGDESARAPLAWQTARIEKLRREQAAA